ncbi:phenylacetate--CoA ligase family protein, partial [candidate division KSB1 bacterium]
AIMNDNFSHLYFSLPAPLRSFAASLYGLRLNHQRYGRDTEHLVERALEREGWSHDQWKRWQEERLGYILHRAATRVPFYRTMWAKQRRQGNSASFDCLENWPVLPKYAVRQDPRQFIADDCSTRALHLDHTSGTTGTPLSIYKTQQTIRAWYALVEARWRRWYGVSRHDRWAILGGRLVTPLKKEKPPFWVWNAPLKQLYMSSYHLKSDLLDYYIDALAKYDVRYLYGFTSSLYSLAKGMLAHHVKLAIKVVISYAQPLLDYQRDVLARAFECPVHETYGMTEIAAAASECHAGRLHLWPEAGIVEIRGDSDQRETAGELICTGLLNPDMPLIRYQIGDRGLLADGGDCSCGRHMRTITISGGRVDNIGYAADGRAVVLGP